MSQQLESLKSLSVSEQGKALFASNELIGRRSRKHRTCDLTKRCLNGWLTLRLLILECCCCEPSTNSSLSRIVLLSEFNRRWLLSITQGKIVLLTVAKLPSDKTPAPSPHAAFLSIHSLIELHHLPAQQHQNPLCCSCALPTWASAKCLRPRASSPYFIPLTFLIAEGLGYQVNFPQIALDCREAKAVPS